MLLQPKLRFQLDSELFIILGVKIRHGGSEVGSSRDTKSATGAAADNARTKRKSLQRHIREQILPEWCPNDGCYVCKAKEVRECTSYKALAGTLNALKVKSPRGKIGTWQGTMVKNLFKDDTP